MPNIRRTLLNIADWGANFDGGHSRWPGSHTKLADSERPPWEASGTPVNRHLCFDGQRLSYSGENGSTERSDLTDGSAVRGLNCFEISLRMHQLPTNIADAWWWLIGPEIHGASLNQAPIQPQVLRATSSGAQGTGTPRKNDALGGGDVRYFMDANAGRGPHRYWDLGPAVVSQWVYFRYNMNFTSGSGGFLEVYRGANRVMRVDDITTAESSGGYWKLPNYSNAGLNGTRGYDWCGARIWDGLCSDRSAGLVIPPPPVEPPPVEPPPPTVTPLKIVITSKGAYEVSNLPTGMASILVGVPGQDALIPPQKTATGTFDVSKLTSGEVYWAWAQASGASGEEISTGSTSFMPEAVTPPPPPPPPPPVETDMEKFLNDLTGDFEAIKGRLAGVETWKRLSDDQRQSIIAARNRAEIGRVRVQAFRETPTS